MRLRTRVMIGAAAIALGVPAVFPALGFPNFVDPEVFGPTTVVSPTFDADVNLKPTVPAVPVIVADGAYHRVKDIFVSEGDPNYNYTLTQLAITSPGGPTGGTCSPLFDYRLSSGGDLLPLSFSFSGVNVDTTYDLELKIPPLGTEANCFIGGAVITATFAVA